MANGNGWEWKSVIRTLLIAGLLALPAYVLAAVKTSYIAEANQGAIEDHEARIRLLEAHNQRVAEMSVDIQWIKAAVQKLMEDQ